MCALQITNSNGFLRDCDSLAVYGTQWQEHGLKNEFWVLAWTFMYNHLKRVHVYGYHKHGFV